MSKHPVKASLLAAPRLMAYLAWTLGLLPLQLIALNFGRPEAIPLIYHRGVLRIFGIRVERRGEPSPRRPTLFVCNHASYLDIEALGALVAGCFVAKSEVSSWPLFGLLARLQRTVFIERQPSRIASQRDTIATRLDCGDNIILFPEGTSSDGCQVLAFKSALFVVAERAELVQPVSIAYTLLNGKPLPSHLRPDVAWYGDMELAGHVWRMLGLGTLTLVVEFHPAVAAPDFPSRKALADYCQQIVAGGLSRALDSP